MTIYIPYFYIIKHIPTNKMYAGSRWKEGCNPDELLHPSGYHTSSKTIHKLITQDGLDSFVILRIDTWCDGLHPYDYETLFLETYNDINWINGHSNKIFSHDSKEFKEMMIKLYGVDHWAKSSEGREFHKQKMIARNNSPKERERWKQHNLFNNPAHKPENRLKHSISMKMTNERMLKDGTHPMLNPENKKLFSNKMKMMRANQPELTCPHCGLKSNAKGNMMRWHFKNCKSNVDTQSITSNNPISN